MRKPSNRSRDQNYFEIVAEALRVCTKYKPKFGKGPKGGLSLDEFRAMYGSDSFYSWIGLDSPLVYSAHKAAGGMTSIYRQLGVGCERLFRQLLQDNFDLSEAQALWKYEVPTRSGKPRWLRLDGRIEFEDVKDRALRKRVVNWTETAAESLLLPRDARQGVKGLVFEVRQGYKSKDSKRQNADLANAASAHANRYLPVMAILSTQIDDALASRYTQARWLLLTGVVTGPNTKNTYSFCREVLGYDLADFFHRYSRRFKQELETAVNALLTP